MRICSFLPSATEIVYALGLGDSLHGVSHECDYPAEASAKPKIVRSNIDSANLTSQEIDRLVSEMYAKGERIYEVDVAALDRAKPDLVITQELCEVCAISLEDVEAAVIQLEMPPQMISLDPHGLDDVLSDIERIGQITDRTTKARELVAEARERIERVRSSVSGTASRPRVACIEWLDPLIVAGHWIPEMVQLAGGIDGLAQPGTPSRRIEIDELIAYDPDVVVLMPCGMDVSRAVHDFSQLGDLDRWRTLSAVKQGNVYAVDAGGLFSRSGPRLVDGVEMLAKMIHPQVFAESLPEESAKRLETLPVSPA